MHLSATITHVMLKDLKLTSEIKKSAAYISVYNTVLRVLPDDWSATVKGYFVKA